MRNTVFTLLFISMSAVVSTAFAHEQLLLEAESFTPTPTAPGWSAKPWGTNYYAATFANTFLSRKAYLSAPAQTPRGEARLDIELPVPGRYLALVRYESVYRHQTQFQLQIIQNNKTKLNRQYGARENLKIQAFKQGLKNEVAWSWGAVENIVWEGHDATVDLEAGPATLILIAESQPEDAANRNVDAILLTTDHQDVQSRIEKENYLPLDGLLTQAGDLYARIHNPNDTPVMLTIPPCTEHSPYWVHQRSWKPKQFTAAPKQSTEWLEVGSLLDSLNDGQWRLTAKSTNPFHLEFGIPTKNGIHPIRRFDNVKDELELAYDADTRSTKRIRPTEEILYDLVDNLKKRQVTGTPPKRTLVYGYTFPPRPTNPKYTTALNAFLQLMGTTAVSPDRVDSARYTDLRNIPTEKLEDHCKKLVAEGRATDIAVVSLGDEITLSKPPNTPKTNEAFQTWLKTNNISSEQPLTFKPSDQTHPAQFYYSQLFTHHHGIQALKQRTDIIKKHLPKAGIGANFSPHGQGYLGETHHWITPFRENALTMPWGEDYIWQIPVASQQQSALMLDMFRSGIAHTKDPNARIHWYVMPHSPGNTPASWRRQFYTALAHGAKVFNLFEFRPVQFAYTENHVNDPDMYQAVRVAMHELGQFEDILQTGKIPRAQTALWFSPTADVWQDNRPPFAAAKRTLYLALRHRQLPLDCVVEGDDLAPYKTIYLTDRHLTRAAARSLADWIQKGGHLVATAGAGMRDEFNRPNTAFTDLLGATESTLDISQDPIQWEKQDLPYAKPMDEINLPSRPRALGARSRMVTGGDHASVSHTFVNSNSPALLSRPLGKGHISYFAFLPGLSYTHPALPRRPLDRGNTDDATSHFIPTRFDTEIADLLARPALSAGVRRPLQTSHPLVDTTLIESPHGLIVPVINWHNEPLTPFSLHLQTTTPWKSATLATGTPLQHTRHPSHHTFTFPLSTADVLILRP